MNIKKYADKHYRNVSYVLFLVLILNWIVSAAKIIFGLISRSSSMTADGFHSFSDGASNVVGLVGITIACRPRDEDHPYGHKKYETFFSLGIAFLLGMVCFELIQEGIRRVQNPVVPNITTISFIVMVCTLLINIAVMKYERRKGDEMNSDILISDSKHTRADILTSASVIITFVAIKLGFVMLDAIITLVIALFIAHAAYEIIREGSRVLCDTAIVDVENIEKIVMSVKGVKSCHKIRTRGRPDDINLDLHVQVVPEMHIKEAHKICYAVENEIKKHMPEITDIVVHAEPRE